MQEKALGLWDAFIKALRNPNCRFELEDTAAIPAAFLLDNVSRDNEPGNCHYTETMN